MKVVHGEITTKINVWVLTAVFIFLWGSGMLTLIGALEVGAGEPLGASIAFAMGAMSVYGAIKCIPLLAQVGLVLRTVEEEEEDDDA